MSTLAGCVLEHLSICQEAPEIKNKRPCLKLTIVLNNDMDTKLTIKNKSQSKRNHILAPFKITVVTVRIYADHLIGTLN